MGELNLLRYFPPIASEALMCRIIIQFKLEGICISFFVFLCPPAKDPLYLDNLGLLFASKKNNTHHGQPWKCLKEPVKEFGLWFGLGEDRRKQWFALVKK